MFVYCTGIHTTSPFVRGFMLKSISITNFQGHKNSTVEFCGGLNVIGGTSDSGKSSIVRAIRWVTENRPSGDSIKNWYCEKNDKVSVNIEMSEGTVGKERTDGKVKYLINSKKGFSEYEAVRSDVPQEVTDLFNLSEINLQTQHDPYFLLNDSPGDVAKKLNSLVGLDIIDTIFKNLNSRILDKKRNISYGEESITNLTNQIESMSWVAQAEIELDTIEEEEKILKNDKLKLIETKDLVEKCLYIVEEFRKITPLISLEREVKEIQNKITDLKEKKRVYKELNSFVQTIFSLRKELVVEREKQQGEKSCLDLKEEINICQTSKKKITEIYNYILLLKQLQEDYNNQKKLTEESRIQLKTLLTEKKICPMCGSSITEKKIKEIVK